MTLREMGMTPRQIPAVIGSAILFVTAVAVGAFVIVSVSPDEGRSVSDAQQGLLMEGMAATKPFDAAPLTPTVGQRSRPNAQALSLAPNAGLTESPPPAETKPDVAPKLGSSSHQTNASANDSTGKFSTSESLQVRRPYPKPSSRPSIPAPRVSLPIQAAPPAIQPPLDGMLTAVEIRRMRLSLRLTREQEPYWYPVEQALMEISVQQVAMRRAGQDPKDAFGIGAGMRVYSAARPLLDQLREDQKALVRARAQAMGFGSIASSI